MPTSSRRVLASLLLAAVLAFSGCSGQRSDQRVDAAGDQASVSTAAAETVVPAGLDPRCQPPATPVAAVQGAGAASPYVDQTVTVQGVVTGDFEAAGQLEGFFLQDPAADGDDATSEALFVHTRADLAAAGDLVRVAGRVTEYFGLTELADVGELVVCASDAAVAPSALPVPFAADLDLESLEGMLVTVPSALTVTDLRVLGRYGTITLAGGGRLVAPTNGTAPDQLPAGRRTLLLDDASSAQDPRPVPYLRDGLPPRLGDTVDGLTGILTFDHDAYRLLPTVAPVFTAANPRSATPPAIAGEVRVAAFNVLNYFLTLGERGASNADELDRQRQKTVAALRALDADLVGLIELENRGDEALDDLVQALNDGLDAGARYAAVPAPAAGFGDDAIRVGLIYRPARLAPVGAATVDGDPVFKRPPLAQTFARGGEAFTVVVTHLKSKGCSDAAGADQDHGQGCYNATRVRQAARLLAFRDALLAGDDDLLLLGDLNAYAAEDPIRTLAGGGLVDLAAVHLPAAERYSYVYDGAAGQLDHAFATPALAARVSAIAIWHVNADESTLLDYNTEHNPPALYRPDPFRSSDHDPLLVAFSP